MSLKHSQDLMSGIREQSWDSLSWNQALSVLQRRPLMVSFLVWIRNQSPQQYALAHTSNWMPSGFKCRYDSECPVSFQSALQFHCCLRESIKIKSTRNKRLIAIPCQFVLLNIIAMRPIMCEKQFPIMGTFPILHFSASFWISCWLGYNFAWSRIK